MKKIFIFLMLFEALSLNAQWINPFNPFANPNAYQDAYNQGQLIGAKINIKSYIAKGDYRAANDAARKAELDLLAQGIKSGEISFLYGLTSEIMLAINWSNLDNFSRETNKEIIISKYENAVAWGFNAREYLSRVKRGEFYQNDRKLFNNISNYFAAQMNMPLNNGGINYNNSNSSSSSSSGRRQCPSCGGSGKGMDEIIWQPDYTGRGNDRYCSTCNRTMSAHSHHRKNCGVCLGSGYVQ